MANSNDEEQHSFAPPFGYVPPAPMLQQMPPYPIIPQQWPTSQWLMPPGMFPGVSPHPISQEYPSRYELVPRSQQMILPNDDYMVNSLSRIYNNEDGSIEIERVKVHRLSGVNGQASLPNISAISTSAPSILSSKKPPPRRKRQKRLAQGLKQESRSEYTVQMPHMQYGYPYPYGYIPYMVPPIYPQPGLHSHENTDNFEVHSNIDKSIQESDSDRTTHHSQRSPQNKVRSTSSSGTHNEQLVENLSSAPPIPKKSIRVHHENPYANEPLEAHGEAATSNTDLLYAFRKLEKNVNNFKDHLIELKKERDENSQENNPSDGTEGRYSETSTLVVDNQSQSAQSLTDTDSTEISFSSEDEDDLSHDDNFQYQWILLQRRQLETANTTNIQQIRTWRKQLVDVLCKGQGLDDADWTTFQLLMKEKAPINDKIELINAGKISFINNNVGVALLRNSLLQVIKYGEMVLKPAEDREGCWKCIRADGDQPWTQVKGCLEILYVFGYRLNGRNLIYHKKSHTKQETIAELTIDILILAEEFRLYLTGVHAAPQEITKLFTEDFVIDQNTAMEAFCEVNLGSSTIATENRIMPVAESSQKPEYENTEEVIKMLEAEHNSNEEKISKNPSLVEDKCSLVKVEESKETQPNETKKVKVEDHVYEEIEEVKSKVDELKKGLPPPLPPKSKRRLMVLRNSKSSDSPNPDMSQSITNVSETGSVCSRRRKRRAPMPPSFSEEALDSKYVRRTPVSKDFSEQSCNTPVALPPKTKRKNTNPFYEEDIKPKGFVGKNPFYEDVECKHGKTKDQATSTEPIPIKSECDNNFTHAETDRLNFISVNTDPVTEPNKESSSTSKNLPIENSNENTKEKDKLESNEPSISTKSSRSEELLEEPINLTSAVENEEVEAGCVILNMDEKIPDLASPDTLDEPDKGRNTKCPQSETVVVTTELKSESDENSPQFTLTEKKENDTIANKNNSKSASISDQDPIKTLNNPISVKEKQDQCSYKETKPELAVANESLRDDPVPDSETHEGKEQEMLSTGKTENSPSVVSTKTISVSCNASTPPTLPPRAILKLVDDIPYIDTNLSQENSESQCSVDSGIGGEKLKVEEPSLDLPDNLPLPTLHPPPPPPSTSPPSSRPPSPTTSPPSSDNSSSSSLVPISTENMDSKKEETEPSALDLLEVQKVSDDVKRMSLHKEEWVFPNKQRADSTVEELTRSSSPSDSGGYEIPENPNRIQEEMDRKKSLLEKESAIENSEKNPLAPLRNKRTKKGPPRPPKPKEDPAPSLPPKGIPSSKSLSSKLKTFPAAFAKNRTPIKWKHKTFSVLRQGCQKQNEEANSETLNVKETKSTPPSPQLAACDRRQTLGNDRTRRSWPSILCECMDPNRTEKQKY